VGGVGGEFKTIRSGEDGATVACMCSAIPSRTCIFMGGGLLIRGREREAAMPQFTSYMYTSALLCVLCAGAQSM
jgi:hypothetical protein